MSSSPVGSSGPPHPPGNASPQFPLPSLPGFHGGRHQGPLGTTGTRALRLARPAIQDSTMSPQQGRATRGQSCPEAWFYTLGSPGTSPLGNEMTHARGQTSPLSSSRRFLNTETDPVQTSLSSHRWRRENTRSLPNYRLRRGPDHLLACSLYCRLPGVSGESGASGLACHQVHREAESVPFRGARSLDDWVRERRARGEGAGQRRAGFLRPPPRHRP